MEGAGNPEFIREQLFNYHRQQELLKNIQAAALLDSKFSRFVQGMIFLNKFHFKMRGTHNNFKGFNTLEEMEQWILENNLLSLNLDSLQLRKEDLRSAFDKVASEVLKLLLEDSLIAGACMVIGYSRSSPDNRSAKHQYARTIMRPFLTNPQRIFQQIESLRPKDRNILDFFRIACVYVYISEGKFREACEMAAKIN